MSTNPRIVALITAFFFLVSQLSGCGVAEPRKYSEDGVKVAAVRPGSHVKIESGSVAVVGRIRVENKHGTHLDASTELAVYVLNDVSPSASVPDWHLPDLIRLDTKPFAPDKDGSFRLVLPKGRYYLQFAYRNNDLGLVSINPRVRVDVEIDSQIAYVGTLVVSVDFERVSEAQKAAKVSYSPVTDALTVSMENSFSEDYQFLVGGIDGASQMKSEQRMFLLDTLKQPDISLGKKQKSGVFNEDLSAGEIILYSAALLVIIPLWVVLAALGGGGGGGRVSW